MDKIKLLDVNISLQPKRELLDYLDNCLESKQPRLLTVVTPNPEQIVLAQEDEHFRNLLNAADIAIPDGWGVTWAIKSVKRQTESVKNLKTIPGVDFMEDLVKLASEKGWEVGLLGGRDGVAQKALMQLQQKYPGLKGWAEDGPKVRIFNFQFSIFNENEEEYFEKLVEKIRETKTRMLFIGLGAPKQEYFIESFKRQAESVKNKESLVFMSVGGAYDEISGKIPRCPKFIQKLGFKWLWRLILEPWRIKRQLQLAKFVQLVLTSKA